MSVPLRNPEEAWSRAVLATVDRGDVERRIGPTSESIEVLAGGFANVNVRIGRDRVLRIRRGSSTMGKEAALLSRRWRSFRTPAVLASGEDFLLLQHLELEPLADTAGEAVGRALAEIHARTYAKTGDLAADLSLATPFPGNGEGGFAARGYGHAMLSEAEQYLDPELVTRIGAFLDGDPYATCDALDVPVLCHCDFKVGNLRMTPSGDLVVLDWEFAWSGPRLLDVGQLLRWQPPEPFVRAFADAYAAGGGVLVDGWRRIAAALDVGNMLGVFAHNPIMRTTDDIPRRILETLDAD